LNKKEDEHMFCDHCGAKLEDDARFCGLCGAKLTPAESVEEAPVPTEEAPDLQVIQEVPVPRQEAAPEVTEPAPEPVPEPVAEPVPDPVPQPMVPPEVPVQPPVFVMPPAAPAVPAKKPYRPKPKPHIALRIPLQILSFLLSFILAFSLLGTVLLADLNHLMSAGGIKQLINAILIPNAAPHSIQPAVGAAGVRFGNETPVPGFTVPGDFDVSDIPSDLINGENGVDMDGLINWIYNTVEEAAGEPLPISKEQVQEFIAESTVSDFVSEKLAGYAEDFINGTENTTITTEELLELLEENQDLLEEKFQVEITTEVKENLTAAVEEAMTEADLDTMIREQVFETVEESIDQTMQEAGMSWEQLQPMLQTLCSDTTLYTAIGICAVLMLLLCLLNFYNIPGGLTWIAVPCILMGSLVTAPLVLLSASPQIFAGMVPEAITGIVASFAGVLLPIHGSVPILGLALLIISIIWRAIRGAVRRSRLRASVA
jgi:hypothetical protein